MFSLVPYPDAPAGDFDAYILPSVFRTAFANDLGAKEAAVLASTQRPATLSALGTPSGPPAWKSIHSWAFVGTLDRVLPPAEQQIMAERARSHITRVKASHLSMISRPGVGHRRDPRGRALRPLTRPTTNPENPDTQGVVMTEPGTPVVFIHGLWLHATSWGPWLDLFREAGYEPTAPGLAQRAGHRRRGAREPRRWWRTPASTRRSRTTPS